MVAWNFSSQLAASENATLNISTGQPDDRHYYKSEDSRTLNKTLPVDFYVLTSSLHFVIALAGVFMNAMVVFVILRRRIFRGKSVFLLIANLACSDGAFLLCMFLVDIAVMNSDENGKSWFRKGDVSCRVAWWLIYTTKCVSLYTISSIAVTRYLTVAGHGFWSSPQWRSYGTRGSTRLICLYSGFLWISLAAANTYTLAVPDSGNSSTSTLTNTTVTARRSCFPRPRSRLTYLIETGLIFVPSTVMTLPFSWLTLRPFWLRGSFDIDRSGGGTGLPIATVTVGPVWNYSHGAKRFTQTILAVLLVFCSLELPYAITNVALLLGLRATERVLKIATAFWFTSALAPALNPLIYPCMLREFNAAFQLLVFCQPRSDERVQTSAFSPASHGAVLHRRNDGETEVFLEMEHVRNETLQVSPVVAESHLTEALRLNSG